MLRLINMSPKSARRVSHRQSDDDASGLNIPLFNRSTEIKAVYSIQSSVSPNIGHYIKSYPLSKHKISVIVYDTYVHRILQNVLKSLNRINI